jgi:hypothetical protein
MSKVKSQTIPTPTALDDLESLYYVCIIWATEGQAPWLRLNNSDRQLTDRKTYFGSGRSPSPEFKKPWAAFLKGIRAALFPADKQPALEAVRRAFALGIEEPR